MAQILKLRRSSVSGQKPTNDNLQLGELAVNTTDGKIFLAKSGSLGPTIEEIVTTNTINTGSINLIGGITVSGDISGSNIKASSFIKSGGLPTQYLMADGSVSTLTNPITGTGTTYYLSKFLTGGTIGNSLIYDDGTSVGIGLTSSTSRLEINPLENQTALKISNYSVTGSNNQSALDISGTWNTTGTPTLIKANVTNIASSFSSKLLDLRVGETSQFNVDRIGRAFLSTGLTLSNTLFLTSLSAGQNGNFISVGTTMIPTTGAVNFANSSINFTPTSGTATFTAFNFTGVINQTGGANGITRGLYINPTLTSAADWRSIEWSNNTGYGLYGVGSANNFLAGNLGIGTTLPAAKLDVKAQGVLSTDIVFRVRNSADTVNLVELNGLGRLGIGVSPTSKFDIQTEQDTAVLSTELLTSSGWTTTGWTGDFTSGFTHTTGNTSILSNSFTPANSTLYQVLLTISGRTAGSVAVNFGGISIGNITSTVNISQKTSSTSNLQITPTSDFNGTITISIKLITAYSPTLQFRNTRGTVTNEIRVSSDSSNTFIGSQAGRVNTTGNLNSFFGGEAGQNNTTGFNNSFFGVQAGLNNTTGNFNSFFGYLSGQNNTTGGNNSFFGNNAGRYISNGNNLTIVNSSVFIGADTKANADNQTNQIVIGSNAVGNGSNSVTLGNDFITKTILKGNVGIGTTIPNSKLDVNGNTTLSGSLMVSQSLIQYSSVASVPSGSVIDVASFNTGSYTATFFDFVITSGSNSRAGTIFTTWNGNNIEYTETSTNDIGNTTSLQLSTSLSAGSVKLQATSIMGSWSVKTLARMI